MSKKMCLAVGAVMLGSILISEIVMAAKPSGGGGGSKSNLVVSRVHDYGPTDPAYRYLLGSDGGGDYVSSRSIVSELQTDGTSWVLDTGWGTRNSTRSTYIDFSVPAPELGGAAPASPPFEAGQIQTRFVLKCGNADPAINLLAMTTDQQATCPLLVHFDYKNVGYRIGMNSNSRHVTEQHGQDALVTCVATDGSGCKSWRLEPTGSPVGSDPNPTNIGMLFDKNGEVLLGYYHFSFLIEFWK